MSRSDGVAWTEEDEAVVQNAIEGMREHDRECERLADKWLGAEQREKFRNFPDLWFRREWYVNRLYEIGMWHGMYKMRQRRCKRTDSPTYLKYETTINELEKVKHVLHLELQELCRQVTPA